MYLTVVNSRMDNKENKGYPGADLSIDVAAEKESRYPPGGESVDDAHRRGSESATRLSDNNTQGVAPSQCEVCGDPVPPTDTTCPKHGNANTHSTGDSRDYDYKVEHISLTIVTASNEYHALALAAAALNHLPDALASVDGTETLYNAADDHIEYDIITAWEGSRPNTAPMGSNEADGLLTRVQEAQDSEDGIGGIVINEYGETISATETACEEEAGSELQSWLVPGVCYNTERNLIGETVRTRHCPSCGETDHVLEDVDTQRQRGNKAQWTCIECDHTHRDVQPAQGKYQIEHYSDHPNPTDGVGKLRRNEFEQVMQRIEADEDMSLEP